MTTPIRTSAEDDADLLERWRAGDRTAGSRLVRKHHLAIAGWFGNAVGGGERQDLTQQTFERITRGMSQFRGECSVKSYFFRVARGVLVDHLRRRHRRDFDPLTHSVEDIAGPSPSRIVGELSRMRLLLRCLHALPMDTKHLLELYYWHGCTAAELGEIFDAPEGTIRRRVFDAKAQLRASLGDMVDPGDDEDTELEPMLRELGALLARGPAAVAGVPAIPPSRSSRGPNRP